MQGVTSGSGAAEQVQEAQGSQQGEGLVSVKQEVGSGEKAQKQLQQQQGQQGKEQEQQQREVTAVRVGDLVSVSYVPECPRCVQITFFVALAYPSFATADHSFAFCHT